MAVQQWPGWAGVRNMFVFGDSYTQNGFYPFAGEPQPAPAHPLGNSFDSYTQPSSGGSCWPNYLTLNYNVSTLLTADLALYGATLGTPDIPPNNSGNCSQCTVKKQIEEVFIPIYVNTTTNLPWKSDNTLFTIFIGVNDVSFVAGNSSRTPAQYYPQEFALYASLLDELYSHGARNFLLLNVPAFDRDPNLVGTSQAPQFKKDITTWNNKLTTMAANLTKTYNSATAFVYDTDSLFNTILDNPRNAATKTQTSGITNTTGACPAYGTIVNNATANDKSCSGPASSYFWHDGLHPMFPVHDAMAYNISKFLSAQPKNT